MSSPWHRWLTHDPRYRRLVLARMNLSMARAEVTNPKTAAAYADAIALLAYAGEMTPTQEYSDEHAYRSAQAESCPSPKMNDDERQCDHCGRVYHESEVTDDICLDCRGYNADGTAKEEPGKPLPERCQHYYGDEGGYCYSANDVRWGRCRDHQGTP